MARRSTIDTPQPDKEASDEPLENQDSLDNILPAPVEIEAPETVQQERPKRVWKRKPGSITEPAKAKSLKDRSKEISLGTRYGGDRKKILWVTAALLSMSLLSPVAIIIALNRPSATQVDDLVAAKLASSGTSFPKGEAVAWAGQVTRTWGSWDEKDQSGMREALMSQFLSQGLDANAGWNGKGKQTVTFVSVNPEPRVQDDTHALVDASYQTDAGTWRCVTLSVFAYKPAGFSDVSPSAFALAANPTPVACAPRTGAPALPENTDPTLGQNDNGSAEKLKSDFLPGFFAAWAASDRATLGQYVTSDATLIGLGGAFESSPLPIISEVSLPTPMTADGESRADDRSARWEATVSVTWTVPGSATQVSASYKVELRKDGNQWFVTKEPAPIVQQEGLGGQPANAAAKGSGSTGTSTPTPTPSK